LPDQCQTASYPPDCALLDTVNKIDDPHCSDILTVAQLKTGASHSTTV